MLDTAQRQLVQVSFFSIETCNFIILITLETRLEGSALSIDDWFNWQRFCYSEVECVTFQDILLLLCVTEPMIANSGHHCGVKVKLSCFD